MGRSPGTEGLEAPLALGPLLKKLCPFYHTLYKMENMRMPELKALARERRLRGYSQLRKAELIAFLQENEHQAQHLHHPPTEAHSRAP